MKKNRRIISAILISSMLLSTACGKKVDKSSYENGNLLKDVKVKEVSGVMPDEKYYEEMTNFAVGLFTASTYGDVLEGQNVLISPESVQLALSMTANGADGVTLEEMKNVLYVNGDFDRRNSQNYEYIKRQHNEEDVNINIANSIWYRDCDYVVNKEFLSIDKTYYDADAYMKPFDDSTINEINSWVSEKTNGKVPYIINNIPDNTVMYLVNATTFDGKWEKEYKPSNILENQKFYNHDGSVSDVTMLVSKEGYYVNDGKAKGFVKPYKGGKYGFYALLPYNCSIEEYMTDMTGKSFLELYNTGDEMEGATVFIPEFDCEYKTVMNTALSQMGMPSAFNMEADFSKMSEDGNSEIYISSLMHRTHIELNREGTKAEAATTVEMSLKCAADMNINDEIILDHPFIYAIVDMQSGMPMFMGVVNSL